MEPFVFLGFGIDAWITIVTLLVTFGVLLFTSLPSDMFADGQFYSNIITKYSRRWNGTPPPTRRHQPPLSFWHGFTRL